MLNRHRRVRRRTTSWRWRRRSGSHGQDAQATEGRRHHDIVIRLEVSDELPGEAGGVCLLKADWPQQVCARGTPTEQPASSRSWMAQRSRNAGRIASIQAGDEEADARPVCRSVSHQSGPRLGMEERAAQEGSCAAICRWRAHCGAGAAAGGMSGTMAVNGGT